MSPSNSQWLVLRLLCLFIALAINVGDESRAAVNNAGSKSIHCERAEITAEKLICTNPALAKQDRDLTNAYMKARDESPNQESDIKADQISWLKKRNSCQSAACISEMQLKRIAEFRSFVALHQEPANEFGKRSQAEGQIAKPTMTLDQLDENCIGQAMQHCSQQQDRNGSLCNFLSGTSRTECIDHALKLVLECNSFYRYMHWVPDDRVCVIGRR